MEKEVDGIYDLFISRKGRYSITELLFRLESQELARSLVGIASKRLGIFDELLFSLYAAELCRRSIDHIVSRQSKRHVTREFVIRGHRFEGFTTPQYALGIAQGFRPLQNVYAMFVTVGWGWRFLDFLGHFVGKFLGLILAAFWFSFSFIFHLSWLIHMPKNVRPQPRLSYSHDGALHPLIMAAKESGPNELAISNHLKSLKQASDENVEHIRKLMTNAGIGLIYSCYFGDNCF